MINGMLQSKLSKDQFHSIGLVNGMLQDKLPEDLAHSTAIGAAKVRGRRCGKGGWRPRSCSSRSCQLRGGRIPERARQRLPSWARWPRLPVPRVGGSSKAPLRRLPMGSRRHRRHRHPRRPRGRGAEMA